MIRRPPRSALFPYTTLFRSGEPAPQLALPVGRGLPGCLQHIVGRERQTLVEEALRLGDALVRAEDEVLGYPLDVLGAADRKSTRLNSSHANISYAVFCL